LRHRVIEIPPITPLVIEHRLHRLACPYSSTSTLLRSPTIGVGLVRLGVSPSVQITAPLGPAEHVKQRRQLQGQQGRHQRQRMQTVVGNSCSQAKTEGTSSRQKQQNRCPG